LRILVITEEDEFYLPLAVQYLLEHCPYPIAEVVCAKNPLLPGKTQAVKAFYRTFGMIPIAQHAARLVKAKVFDRIGYLNRTGRHFSVARTCRAFDKPCSQVDDINAPEFLEHCRDLKIDLIASVSPTQIFKEQLIELPPHGCINIHTAKLPEYRGLYPTYWAMACGEKSVGISIHYIEKGIDTGKIILQDEVEIPPAATLDHMLTTTKLRGAELLIEAIKQIAEGRANPHYPRSDGSYFSFPTPESYQQFKRRGYKLW